MLSLVSIAGALLILANVIGAFFVPEMAANVFIGSFIVLFQGWLVVLLIAARPPQFEEDKAPYFFTGAEIEVIEKYALIFRFPGTSRSFAAVVALISLAGFVLVPWLAYRDLWVQAVIIAVNTCFAAGQLTRRLDPERYLAAAAEKGLPEYVFESGNFESAWEKILASRK